MESTGPLHDPRGRVTKPRVLMAWRRCDRCMCTQHRTGRGCSGRADGCATTPCCLSLEGVLLQKTLLYLVLEFLWFSTFPGSFCWGSAAQGSWADFPRGEDWAEVWTPLPYRAFLLHWGSVFYSLGGREIALHS